MTFFRSLKFKNKFLPAKILLLLLLFTNILYANEQQQGVQQQEIQLNLYSAVKSTLQDSLNIKLKQLSVDFSKAVEKSQAGAFDVNLSFMAQTNSALITKSPYELGLPIVGSEPRTYLDQDVHSLSTSITKKFRNGISTSLSYLMTQYDHPVPDPMGAAIPTTNSTQLNFKVDIPLLKGSGKVSSGAAENAAILESRATEADYKHLVSQTVLTTVNRYWDYVAAYSINAYLAESKRTIDTWHRKSNHSDNHLLAGYRAEKQSSLIESEKVLQASAIALASAMGIQATAIETLGKPNVEGFPKNWREELKNLDAVTLTDSWTNMALQNRNDIQALKIRLDAAQILLAREKNNLNPSLNLSFSYGTDGFSYGNSLHDMWQSASYRVRTPAFSGALVLNYPLSNSTAKGAYSSSFAAKEMASLQLNETIRQLKLSVHNDVNVLMTSRNKAFEADKSLKSYVSSMMALVSGQSIDDLREINSLLTLQDRLDAAAVVYFNALSGLINAIANSRFEVGLLLSSTQALDEGINLKILTSLP